MLATRTHGGLFRHPFFRFDPVFDALFQEAQSNANAARPGLFRDTGKAYSLRVVIPGVPKEDVSLSIERDVLTVVAERKIEVPEGYEAVRRERKSWRLDRSVALPDDADPETVTAAFDLGVLTITVDKTEAPASRQIQIA